MTKFKDVAHLYVGCEAYNKFYGHYLKFNEFELYRYTYDNRIHQLKPILRPLSSMIIEEGAWCLKEIYFDHVTYPISDFKLELVGVGDVKKHPRISINNDWFQNNLTFGNSNGSIWAVDTNSAFVKIKPTLFAYLLKKHFDLFGLIDSGEAIDSTTVNPTT